MNPNQRKFLFARQNDINKGLPQPQKLDQMTSQLPKLPGAQPLQNKMSSQMTTNNLGEPRFQKLKTRLSTGVSGKKGFGSFK